MRVVTLPGSKAIEIVGTMIANHVNGSVQLSDQLKSPMKPPATMNNPNPASPKPPIV